MDVRLRRGDGPVRALVRAVPQTEAGTDGGGARRAQRGAGRRAGWGSALRAGLRVRVTGQRLEYGLLDRDAGQVHEVIAELVDHRRVQLRGGPAEDSLRMRAAPVVRRN